MGLISKTAILINRKFTPQINANKKNEYIADDNRLIYLFHLMFEKGII